MPEWTVMAINAGEFQVEAHIMESHHDNTAELHGIVGIDFDSSKINSNKVFRAFCLIVKILLWSYLVQGVQKAVQNRIFFDRF